MATKPSKLKSGKPLTRFGALKTRFGAFFVDWALWGFVAYEIVFLLNHYWYTEIHFYGRLTVPTWGWPIVILGTLELAAISHAFTHSIGLSLFGLRMLTQDYQYPTRTQRLRRYLGWQVLPLYVWLHVFVSSVSIFLFWNISAVFCIISVLFGNIFLLLVALFIFSKLKYLFPHDRMSRTAGSSGSQSRRRSE